MFYWAMYFVNVTANGYAGCNCLEHYRIYSVIGSMCFFVRLTVSRFGRALRQTHSLPSLGLSVGLCGLAMWVAVQGWHIMNSYLINKLLTSPTRFLITGSYVPLKYLASTSSPFLMNS